MADPITPAAESVTEKPAGIRDDWDGIVSDGVTLVSTDATPEQIAKTLGVELEPEKPVEPPIISPVAAAGAEPIPEERPKGKSIEARIAQARFDQRESDRRERATAERAADLERKLAAATAAPPAAVVPARPVAAAVPETFPNWEAWSADTGHEDQTYEDYLDARGDWRNAKRGFISREEAEQLAVTKAQELREQEFLASFEAKERQAEYVRQQAFLISREEAKTTHEDYAEVVEESTLPTNPVMDEIFRRAGPQAGELLYYLGSHPEECQRIAALPTAAEVIESMTRIKITLEGAPRSGPPSSVIPVTRAPAPPEPVGAARHTSPAASLLDPRTSLRDFMKIRDEQERTAAGRF